MDTMEDNRATLNMGRHLALRTTTKFLLRSVYDLLLSPANLHRGGLVENPKCYLCDKPGTMQHALSSCQTALAQGHYRWRHNTVLRELVDMLESERRKKRHTKKKASQRSTLLRKVKQARKQRPQQHQSLMNLIAGR